MNEGPFSVRAAAREAPGAAAIVDDEGVLDWASLAALVEARGAAIDARPDADPSTPLALVGAPTREAVIDALAAIELGVPLALLHPRWTDAEREAVVDATGARPLALGAARIPRAHDGAIDDARTLAIIHTSGTTGRAKGAVLSRRAFLASARASEVILPLGPGDRWLLCMPIAHVGGLSVVVRSLVARAAVVIAGPFDAARTRTSIARHAPTVISLVPTMLARLLDAGFVGDASLRAVLLGGAGCSERLLLRGLEASLPLRTTYGLTEACSQVATTRRTITGAADGAGVPLPGTDVRIGARGTIEVRGPTLFDGWLGVHAPPFDDEGWYDTGDLGRLDDEGRLHVLSRRTDLIVRGGENVYPAEVEAALEDVPGVEAACVFGVPDEALGQRVEAAIVVAAHGPDDVAIEAALRLVIAGFKVPRRFVRLPALEVAPSGKLDRAATAARALHAVTTPTT